MKYIFKIKMYIKLVIEKEMWQRNNENMKFRYLQETPHGYELIRNV